MTRQVTLGEAVDAFFADKDLAANTRRTYHQTLDALTSDHTTNSLVAELTATQIRDTLRNGWAEAAPSTWNARLTALQSFSRYCERNGWTEPGLLDGVERKREPRDETRALTFAELEQIWNKPNVAVREKTLWRMLYETAAQTNEILAWCDTKTLSPR